MRYKKMNADFSVKKGKIPNRKLFFKRKIKEIHFLFDHDGSQPLNYN